MIKRKIAIICLSIFICGLATASIIRPLNEDPPSVLSSLPAYSNRIC